MAKKLVAFVSLIALLSSVPVVSAQSAGKVVYATTDISKGTAFAPENIGLRNSEPADPPGACTTLNGVYGFKANCSIARRQAVLRSWLVSAAPAAETEIWVAKAEIKQGDLLSAENVEIRKLPSGQVPPQFIDGASRPQGRQTRVSIRPGEALTEAMLFSAKPVSDLNVQNNIPGK